MADEIYDDQQPDDSQSSDPSKRHYSSEFSPEHADHTEDTPDRDALKDAEESAGESGDVPTASNETPAANDVADKENTGDEDAPPPNNSKSKPKGLRNRAKSRWKNFQNKVEKRFAIIVASILIVLTPLLILLAFLLLALKVPHFVANVSARQFAKVTRIQAASQENVSAEEAAMKGADDTWYGKLRTRYSNMKDNTFRNLERISPAIVVRNLQASGNLKYVETPRGGALGKLGFTRIKAITINDRSVITPQSMFSYTDKYIHPIQTIKDRIAFYQAVDDALRTYNPNLNMLVRDKAALNILTARFGNVGFKGILMANFFGKSKVDAATEMQAEAYAAAESKVSTPKSAPDEVNKTTQKVADDTDACVKDPNCLKNTTSSTDGFVAAAEDEADSAFTGSAVSGFLKGAIGVLNPIYAVAVPVCLVKGASDFDPQASNNQSDSLQREATQVFAADAQIKRGDVNTIQINNGQLNVDQPTTTDQNYNVNGDGVGALSQKLDGVDGNGIIDSNAFLQSDGQQPNTLQTGLGTQQPALGGYGTTTIFDTLLPGAVAGALNGAADKVCPYATNVWAGAALGVANLIIAGGSAMISAGSAAAAEYGSETSALAAARIGMQIYVKKVIESFSSKAGAVQAFGKTGRFGAHFGTTVTRDTALIVGAAYLAKMWVMFNSSALHNGLQNGVSYANDIDNGTNQIGNTVCQGVYYGRFLTYAEIAQNDQDDRQVSQAYAQSQSTYQRYFALSNPDSMLTKFGEATVMKVNRNTVASALSSLTNIFNPMSFLPKLFGSFTTKAAAAANVQQENYGNMQCGYTRDEYALIHGQGKGADGSYASPSENAFRLDNAGVDAFNAIEKEYGPCFTQKIGDLKTSKDSDGHTYLVQTGDGDLSPDSVCSPQNLGPDNPTYGDLVFRYRLEHMYNTSIQNQYDVQQAGTAELGSSKGTLAL